MHRLCPFSLLVLLFFSCANPPFEYDILIKNATTYDGSGESPTVGVVAINGDKIADVGQLENVVGKQEI
ncbi:MAG: hypothetical protein AAGJ18_02990 [Bacteroidota bacterium]